MKTATVPAQITTVEDKIAGNLTLQQMILLASPVFIDFVIYATPPETLKLCAYKLFLIAIVTLTMISLAVRIRGKVLLNWTLTILKYNGRPRYYVYNKNNNYLRADIKNINDGPKIKPAKITEIASPPANDMSEADIIRLEQLMDGGSTSLIFSTSKKGGLSASITEIR